MATKNTFSGVVQLSKLKTLGTARKVRNVKPPVGGIDSKVKPKKLKS